MLFQINNLSTRGPLIGQTIMQRTFYLMIRMTSVKHETAKSMFNLEKRNTVKLKPPSLDINSITNKHLRHNDGMTV